MPTAPSLPFPCGHPRVPANIIVRKKTRRHPGSKPVMFIIARPEASNRYECRVCYNERMKQAQRRRRARLQAFKDELYAQLPPELPSIEPCKEK